MGVTILSADLVEQFVAFALGAGSKAVEKFPGGELGRKSTRRHGALGKSF